MRKKTNIRALSLLLGLVMILGLLPGTTWARTLTGDGTVESPYLIANAEDLAAFRDQVNGGETALCAKLTADITLSGEWTPFTSSSYVNDAYAGTFDGDYHTITGLNINADATNQGLFGMINGATIRNLKVIGRINCGTKNYIGGIVGRVQAGTIENCSFSGSVSGGYTGGIAGSLNGAGVTIRNCCNEASVSGTYAGGVLGYSTKNATIVNCYNAGTISGTGRTGGIIGQLSSGTITNCYNIGALGGTATYKSGICAFNQAATTNCFYSAPDCEQPGGTASEGTGPIASPDHLLTSLGSAYTADTGNINQGYPILTWQEGKAPIPSHPKITIIGRTFMYDVNAGPKPDTSLEVQYTDMFPAAVTWSLISGEDVVELVTPDNADENNSTILVRALAPGKATVQAKAGNCSDTMEITVFPFVTTVKIEGASVAGKTVRAKINVLNGELDYETFPVKIQWRYLAGSDYAAGNTGAYHNIPGADGLTYTIPEERVGDYLSFTFRWNGEDKSSSPSLIKADAVEVPDPQPSTPDQSLEEVLEWYTMRPVFGRDTNVNRVLEQYLAEHGFGAITASVRSVKEVYGGANIAPSGDITYFYADPNTTPAVKFGSYQVTFSLSNRGESFEIPVILYWDAAQVRETMAQEIAGKISIPSDEVTGDVTLPRVVDGKTWTLISWTSSDEDVISVSDQNQSTADTLFAPYVGVVKRGETDRRVTLTARFNFQFSNSGEAPITLVHTYSVLVKALDQADRDSLQASLMAKLDAGFAKKGLTDALSGSRLTADADGVYTATNDIQFPTTRDFGVDGKYNPVTITTNNSAALKVPDINNAARVDLLRPGVGQPNAEGTLTITLHDRNTSVTASKEFKIRVPALTQEEIDTELALMERVRASYFEGIRGSNDAKDNVRTNLTPFLEVYEKDGRLVWVRTNSARTGQGIVPVPMEGWEDLELWRLFRSSNPNVISHENLIVTRQAEAKAVTITSRLSSQTLGRYGELYMKNPAKYPQYADLAPLYYQEATTNAFAQPASARTAVLSARTLTDTIVVRGTRDPDSPIPVAETVDNVTFTLTGLDGAVWIADSFTGLDETSTVYDLFVKSLGSNYTATRVKGTYIKAISGPNGSLAEKQYGENSGWMYRVGGRIPDVYMGACPLRSGDTVQVFYTRDAKTDDPNWNRPSGGSSSSGGASSGGSPSGSSSSGAGSSGGAAAQTAPQTVQIKKFDDTDSYAVTLPANGPHLVTIPDVKQGQLVVIVGADGQEKVIRKSILEGNRAKFLLAQDAAIKVRDYVNPFDDVANSAWYASAVDFAAGRGLFTGVSPDSFAPDLPLSRGMLAAVLYRLEEPDVRNSNARFSDVASGAWHEQAIAWAADSGIVSGYGDGRFGPDDNITREQLAVMLLHYAQLLGMSTAGRDSLASDSGAVSPWAQEAVAWAVDCGIISGLPDGTLAPSATATRAEAAAMLQRFVSILLR